MKFIDINGREHNKSLSKYERKKESKSKGQQRLGDELEQLFPNVKILEEVPCFGTRLKIDFFMPSVKIAFEFDGRQHEEFNEFFHGNKLQFAKSQLNDMKKHHWCEINKIILIRIKEDDFENLQEIIYERSRHEDDQGLGD